MSHVWKNEICIPDKVILLQVKVLFFVNLTPKLEIHNWKEFLEPRMLNLDLLETALINITFVQDSYFKVMAVDGCECTYLQMLFQKSGLFLQLDTCICFIPE